ncbi:MAG TPA: SusD/RagB family nutrient-binding outer membrane lipoprotein [Cytophagales bacterium]|nr:SusD/RagB family nutrient-binding outer membrane lipoprotein [Cytophagales bacterium]
MRNLKIFLLVFLLISFTSCNDFLDINTSPNEPADVPVELVFPAAVGSTAYVLGGWYQILGGMWAQHWTQSTGASQYRDIDSYDLQTDAFDDRQYGELYTGALNDYKYIRETAKQNENWSFYLMATVMQAYTYQVLADIYDEIPFSESLQGEGGLLTPKFDGGQVVYDSLIARIDEALAKDLSAVTVEDPGTKDVVFGGDMTKWVQFANTLKLKIYIRQVEVRESVAFAGIQSLFANPNFLTVDAKFSSFKDEPENRNPVYETGVDRLGGSISISRTLFSFLQENGDPRLNEIMDYPVSSPTLHNTLVQGDYLNTLPTNIQGLSTPTLEPLDAVYFISAAESYFLQAEAVVRAGVAGDAQSLYNSGIEASFEKFGATGASDVYEDGKVYAFPTAGTLDQKIEAIVTQKWVSMANSQGLEAFFEQNRTGYPDFFTVAVNNVTSGQFPKRLFFPQSERTGNPGNLPAIKPLTEPVWWAK